MPKVDFVFLGLKTTANDSIASLVGPLMGPNTHLMTAQNGLGNEQGLADLLGAERIYGGLAFLCSNRLADGTIHHIDYGHLHVGKYNDVPDQPLQQFADLLAQGGIESTVVADLALARWKKLVWNVPFNGLSALTDQTVDRLMASKVWRERAWRLMKEVQDAARAHQLAIEAAFLQRMMDYSDKMKPYYTSMHVDIRAGRPLELEAIIGEPLRRGRDKGVAMPEMSHLYQQLQAINPAGD